MKPNHRKILTHLVCAVAGICVAGGIRSAVVAANEDGLKGEGASGRASDHSVDGNGVASQSGSARQRESRAGAPLRSKDFRDAWNAIANRKDLTARERAAMQRKLLKEWSMVDLQSAMAAALEGNWDADDGGVHSLLPAFREAFLKNPMEAWGIIHSGKLGMGSSLFRWQWVTAVSTENPLLVLSCFNDFSDNLQKAALWPILELHSKDPKVTEAILKMLRDRPADAQTKTLAAEFFKQVPPNGTPEELAGKLATAGTEQEKIIALQAFAASLKGQDPELIKSLIGNVPPESRGDIVRQLLAASGNGEPTALLNLAIASGNWDILKDPMVAGVEGKVAEYARRNDPIAIAEWGLSLPDRPETQDIYRRAITGYIDRYPAEARDWIMSIPEGDWRRERALMEYSQNALWYKRNQEGAAWAIDRISDPKLKGTAMNWRIEWAQRNGVQLK